MRIILILTALILTACNAQALTDTRAALVTTHDAAATQPGGAGIARDAQKGIEALDKIAPVVNDVAALKASVADLTAKNATLGERVVAAEKTAQGAADLIHKVAPNTPADNTAATITAIGGIVIAAAGIFAGRSTAHTAITTPGTTDAPGGKS